jgi:tetratricopeptide (TPR) repeat protein
VQVGLLYVLALKISKAPVEALSISEELSRANPEVVPLRVMFAANLMGIQEYGKAYEMLIQLRTNNIPPPNKDYGTVLWMIGRCELYLGRHEDAVRSLEEALEYVNDAVTFLTSLGEAYVKTGDTARAKEKLTRALDLNASYPDALYWMGVCTEPEDMPKAIAYFEKTLKEGEARLQTNSDNGADHYLLYLTCQKLGDLKKTEKYKKAAAELKVTFDAPWKEGLEQLP